MSHVFSRHVLELKCRTNPSQTRQRLVLFSLGGQFSKFNASFPKSQVRRFPRLSNFLAPKTQFQFSYRLSVVFVSGTECPYMAPQTRRTSFPNVLIERDTDSERSSSDEEEEGEEEPQSEEEEEETVLESENRKANEEASDAKKKGKAPITISLKKVCKVCKKAGHEAGFKGATYIDCPMKPCFLCKMPGHTTMTCPHRVVTEHGVIPAPHRDTQNPVEFVFGRQLKPRITRFKPAYVIPDQVHCAAIRYHSRWVTCLEFHPTNNNILLSGDKVSLS
ncbi:hypothetical protein SLEP1_g35543 [Rubroshorea leprosula]|uniref:Uncharacterized protein n=1 Tax=Rubroshorea leprosula TaxID=152421 RepID=A0AAV5KNJ0_9ROSI|nr:hypothetical protein SLEP1_g35543 [Rubroshorea leprosula]